ncbi:MAG: hypothetical protein AB4372_13350 [Xenococcus sp. (in: cyanobacteria)]
MNKINKLTEKQAEEYAIALLKDKGLFEAIMLLAGITHDQAEASGDKELMADSDLIFELVQKLNRNTQEKDINSQEIKITDLIDNPKELFEYILRRSREINHLTEYRYLKEESSSESQRIKPKFPSKNNPGWASRLELAKRLGVSLELLDYCNSFGTQFLIWTQFLDPEGREWFCQGDLCHCSELPLKDEKGNFIYKKSSNKSV